MQGFTAGLAVASRRLRQFRSASQWSYSSYPSYCGRYAQVARVRVSGDRPHTFPISSLIFHHSSFFKKWYRPLDNGGCRGILKV